MRQFKRPTMTQTKKTFCISKRVCDGVGKKIFIYSDTGMGKSTLACMLPNNVFLDPDDGLDEGIVNPKTGELPDIVTGIETFQDLRDAIQDHDKFKDYDSVTIENLTFVQDLCGMHVVNNIPKEKGGKAKSLNDFGWAKGYAHVYDMMQLLLVDLDNLRRTGKNIILLSQKGNSDKSDSTYGDFHFAQPDLYDKKNSRVARLFISWCSYVWKIDHAAVEIGEDRCGVATKERAIFTKPELSFEAKSRGDKFDEFPVVSFAHKADDSVWRLLFDD